MDFFYRLVCFVVRFISIKADEVSTYTNKVKLHINPNTTMVKCTY